MWSDAAELFPRVYGASLVAALLVTAMMLTVVLIPVALFKGVKWYFTAQAVVIDRASVRDAFRVSSNRTTGHWLRGFAVVIAVGVISGFPGPLIGTIGLVLDYFSLDQAQLVSAAIYCVLYPIAVIMATLYYLRTMVSPGKTTVYLPESGETISLDLDALDAAPA
jgi:membrane-anchored glycerophosphoryl diester phosphodiesterase (GDPDase)